MANDQGRGEWRMITRERVFVITARGGTPDARRAF
jgi:hypothetical protein